MPVTLPFSDSLRAGLTAANIAFDDDGGQFRIPGSHPDVGDLLITPDDTEITVFVGNFTHRHFTPYEAGATHAANTIEDCVRDALEYVRGIVNDQWVLWAYPGGAGGAYRLGAESEPTEDAPPPDEQVIRYVWSGPYDSRRDKSQAGTRVQ